MRHRLQDAAAARRVRMQHVVHVRGGGDQRRLGSAHAHAGESFAVHRQVVERVAGHQHAFARQLQRIHQRRQRAALLGVARQDVQVAVGRIQHFAAQRRGHGLHLGLDGRQLFGMAVVRAAAFLRHFLAHQHREAAHRLGHHVLARPARLDPRLQRLDRLHVGGAQHGGADIADDVIGRGQAGIGEQRQDRFTAATGDPRQLDVGMGVDQVVQALARFRIAGQEGAVQIGGQQQRLVGLFQHAHAGALHKGEMPRTRHDAKASTDAGGESHRIGGKRRDRAQETRCRVPGTLRAEALQMCVRPRSMDADID